MPVTDADLERDARDDRWDAAADAPLTAAEWDAIREEMILDLRFAPAGWEPDDPTDDDPETPF